MNLYFNSSGAISSMNGMRNMHEESTRRSSISQLNNNNFTLTGKQYAEDLYVKALYDLHKKDMFVPLML